MRRWNDAEKKRVGMVCLVAGALIMLCLVIVSRPVSVSPDQYTSVHQAATPAPLMGLSPDSLLNVGDAEALDQLPGIGTVLAGRIIEVREQIGGFELPEDLMYVKGIGEKKLADIMEALDEPLATLSDLR